MSTDVVRSHIQCQRSRSLTAFAAALARDAAVWGTPMRFIAAVIVFFGCLDPEAVAQEIPDYDTQAFCERRTGADTADNRRFAACLLIEDLGPAELEDYWPEANETMRVDCIEEANLTESYVALASCVMAHVREHRRR